MSHRKIVGRKVVIDNPFTSDGTMISVQLLDLSSMVDRWKVQYGEDAVFTVENDGGEGLDCVIHYKSIETQKEFDNRVAAEKKHLAGLEKGKKNRRALYERLKKEFEGQ